MEGSAKQFKKRNAILACLRGCQAHPSAEMIYGMLRQEHPDISLATVYRNLSWFRSRGLVQSLGAVNGAERFDPCTQPHVHFICSSCGSVLDLPQISLPYDRASETAREQNIRIDGCQLTYTGLCSACKTDVNSVVISVESIPQDNLNFLEENIMKKFVCPVCGYVYEGEALPEDFKCPVCKVDGSKFKVMESGKLAAEHELGIYEKTVANNPDISDEDKAYILEQLKANFNGECSEVGMYLCMARVAYREGYPEIGMYWEKAAYEEAEHAAKFAEILGSTLEPNMTGSTKKNLAWRVDCEFGATQGKFDLAACAKKNGLDAIHDTVHEMAKDEARHGKALKGLHDRYFAADIAKEKVTATAKKAATEVAGVMDEAAKRISELLKK